VSAYKDQDMQGIFAPHMQPGEGLMHWAYGVKQPHIMLIILFIATIGGVIAVMLMTKHYLVGLTSHGRVLVLEMGGKKVKACRAYQLGQTGAVKTSTGALFTHINLVGPPPFKAKFHRLGMAKNREHSQAIASALEGRQLAA
jgi:hypothetical protein